MEILIGLIMSLLMIPATAGWVIGLRDRKIRPWMLWPMGVLSLWALLICLAAMIFDPGEFFAAFSYLAGWLDAYLIALAWWIGLIAGAVWLLRRRGWWSTIWPYLLALYASMVVVGAALSSLWYGAVMFLLVSAGFVWWYRRRGSH